MEIGDTRYVTWRHDKCKRSLCVFFNLGLGKKLFDIKREKGNVTNNFKIEKNENIYIHLFLMEKPINSTTRAMKAIL